MKRKLIFHICYCIILVTACIFLKCFGLFDWISVVITIAPAVIASVGSILLDSPDFNRKQKFDLLIELAPLPRQIQNFADDIMRSSLASRRYGIEKSREEINEEIRCYKAKLFSYHQSSINKFVKLFKIKEPIEMLSLKEALATAEKQLNLSTLEKQLLQKAEEI